jgi:hypothetical protein
MNAATANEINRNLGPDFSMADAFDAAYLDVEAAEVKVVKVEDVDLMSVEQRQKLNARLAEWFNG